MRKITTVILGLVVLTGCYSYKWNDASAKKQGAYPEPIMALFDAQPGNILSLDIESPGADYDYDIGEKDNNYALETAYRFTHAELSLCGYTPQGQVLVDFLFKDDFGNSVAIDKVDLLRLTPQIDSDGEMIQPEFLLEEFNRFGLNFRGEHKEFKLTKAGGKVSADPYRVNITNNCLAATKWEFALTTEDYHDFGSRCKSEVNLNQNKILSHSWFYLNNDLYTALLKVKNPGKEIPLDLDYNELSNRSEEVHIDFETLRNPLRRRVDLNLLEVGHQSKREIEPLDVEQFYKKQFGLLLAPPKFTYASILDQPVQTMQFQDRGYYTAETPKEFDFGWMKHLDQVEMDVIDVKGSDSYVQINLTGEWSPYDITIGNVDLALINEQKLYGMLFGMNTMPKSRRYNPVQNTIQYDASLFPDELKPFVLLTDKKSGKWVNNQYKGVEKIYLTYDDIEMDVLNVYVLCYERITPVWMASVKLPKEIRETVRIRKKLYNY